MSAPRPNKRVKITRGAGGYVARYGYNNGGGIGGNGDRFGEISASASAVLGMPNGATTDYNNIGGGKGGAAGTRDSLRNPIQPVASYYKDNWEMMQSQPELMMHVFRQGDYYLSKGLVFMTEDGLFCEPTPDFESMIEYYLLPAMRQAIMWFFCYGFVVWFKTFQHGREVMFVPAPSQVKVSHVYDAKTGAPEVILKWASDKVESQLYYYKGGPFSITSDFQCAPFDAVGPLIQILNEMITTRLLTMNRVARPPMVIQEVAPRGARNAAGQDDDSPTMDATSQYMLEFDAQQGDDDALYERLHEMQERVEEDAEANRYKKRVVAVPPWQRRENAMSEPPSRNFVPIPKGMVAVSMSTPVHDFEYNKTQKQIVDQINALLGFSPDNVSEETKKIDDATSYKWRSLLGDFATSMFRTLYHNSSVRMFDERPTWEEEKKLNEMRVKFTVDDIFEDSVKTASKGVIDSDFNEDGSPVTLGEMLRKKGTTVRVILKTHLLEDRDLCEDYMRQGGMSRDTFDSLHPPIEREEPANATKKK